MFTRRKQTICTDKKNENKGNVYTLDIAYKK